MHFSIGNSQIQHLGMSQNYDTCIVESGLVRLWLRRRHPYWIVTKFTWTSEIGMQARSVHDM